MPYGAFVDIGGIEEFTSHFRTFLGKNQKLEILFPLVKKSKLNYNPSDPKQQIILVPKVF